MNILFKNASILVKNNGKYEVLKNAYLGVENDSITHISTILPTKKYDLVKNMNYKLLIPGLIDAHGHSAMTLLRGVGSGLPLHEWLNNAIFPIEAKLTPYDVYLGTKLSILEMLASGIVCCSDMYDFPYAGAKAYAEAGFKANMCRTGLSFDPNEDMSKHLRLKECKEVADILAGKANSSDELKNEIGSISKELKESIKKHQVVGDLSLHSEYLTTPAFVRKIKEYSDEKGYYIQVHISETIKEVEECKARHNGMTPVQYFDSIGLFDGQKVYAAHCVHLEPKDIEIFKKHNITIVHNPESNCKLGSGFADIRKYMDNGINVAIGTDGCASNNNLNMFEEMHTAALLQAGLHNDPTAISVDEILDMATINGAKAMGRIDMGELKVGNKADIVGIDLSKPHLQPQLDLISLLVYSVQASDVCMTMVDGNILYENGRYTTLDKKQIYKETNKFVKRMFK